MSVARTAWQLLVSAALAWGMSLLVVPPAGAADTLHWNRSSCGQCHGASPPEGRADLSAGATALCAGCHEDGDAPACPHRAGVPAGAMGVDPSLAGALQEGEIACTTCHDLAIQCRGGRDARYRNPAFVRGGPYRQTGEFCFQCHRSGDYKKLSPHRQVRRGEIQEGTCLFCHAAVPGQEQRRAVEFRMRGDLDRQCTGCHPVAPHPMSVGIDGAAGGWVHLVQPPEDIRARMADTASRSGATLPLDPYTGKIFCATCHNPHDKALAGYPVADPSGDRAKLRVPDICGACHAK